MTNLPLPKNMIRHNTAHMLKFGTVRGCQSWHACSEGKDSLRWQKALLNAWTC